MVAPSGARRRSPPWEWSNGAGFAGDVCQRSPKHRPGALETAAPRARAGSAQAHSALAPPRPRASRFLGLRSCACAEAFRVRLLGRPAEAAPAQCCRSAALLIWPAVGRGHLATYHRLTEGGAPGSRGQSSVSCNTPDIENNHSKKLKIKKSSRTLCPSGELETSHT